MSLPMRFVDFYTLIQAVILAIGLLAAVLGIRDKDDDEDEDRVSGTKSEVTRRPSKALRARWTMFLHMMRK
jgi:hypothetical protein